jgi:hypothetical protein
MDVDPGGAHQLPVHHHRELLWGPVFVAGAWGNVDHGVSPHLRLTYGIGLPSFLTKSVYVSGI